MFRLTFPSVHIFFYRRPFAALGARRRYRSALRETTSSTMVTTRADPIVSPKVTYLCFSCRAQQTLNSTMCRFACMWPSSPWHFGLVCGAAPKVLGQSGRRLVGGAVPDRPKIEPQLGRAQESFAASDPIEEAWPCLGEFSDHRSGGPGLAGRAVDCSLSRSSCGYHWT